jgi:membrane-bound serine protease (ClpP class)
MKRYILILGCLSLLTPMPSFGETESTDLVYVIPIKGMIERGLLYSFRRGLKEAEKKGAKAIILDMDTPGGKLQSAEEMVLLLLDASVPTYTFVNPRAISAGAIIAMATDGILMTPPALIGDAMPIMMSPLPMGGAKEIPDGLREKVMSPTLALVRSAAQAKGHDPSVGEAMIRPEFTYSIGDHVVSVEGELLTLTSEEATKPVREDGSPLLAKGIVKDFEDCLSFLGLQEAKIVKISVTPSERIARFIEGYPLSGILMALGLLGLYIEFKTPGFGIPGLAGLLCLALWFWGHHIAGLAGMTELAMFIVGAVLLLLEIFVIPGFGVAGISGLVMMVAAIIMAMLHSTPPVPIDYDFPLTYVRDKISSAVLTLVTAIGITVAFGIVLAKTLPGASVFNRIMLRTEMKSSDGYQSAQDTSDVVGASGVAVTPLRPSGIAEIEGKRLSVVARGSFIEKDSAIVVTEKHGNRIVVDERA